MPSGNRTKLRIASLLLLCLFTIAPAHAAALEVGAASRDITPTEPVPMWGYGGRHAALSQGALDPLLAKAIVIRVGDEKLAIVGLDLGRSPNEQSLVAIRERIAKEAGVRHSLIAGSHTHHGPVLELTDRPGRGKEKFDAAVRYNRKLEDDLVAVIVEAEKNCAPAAMAVGSVQLEGFNRNRHSKLDPVVDRELTVMRFDDVASGKPKAVLVNFAAHPTSVDAAGLRFSSDFVGALRTTIEAELPGATAVFMQGASGDLSTDRRGKDHSAYGKALGTEALKLARSLEPAAPANPALKSREEVFKFPARINVNDPATRVMYSVAFFPELVANYFDDYAGNVVRPRLTVVTLGQDVALVGASGEFFAAHAIRLKQRARTKHVLFFGYCNGYHQYFPTIEGAAEGGYGADPQVAPAAVGAGERITDTALLRIYQLRGDIRK